MMSQRRLLVTVAVATAILASVAGCIIFMDDHAGMGSNYVVLDEKTRIIQPGTVESELSLAEDGSTVTLPTAVAEDLSIEIGSILVSPPSTTNPEGLLRAITSITQSGGTTALATRQATILEAIEECRIDHTLTTEDRLGQQTDVGPMKKRERTIVLLDKSFPINYDLPVDSAGTVDGHFTLDGHLDVQVTVRFELEIAKDDEGSRYVKTAKVTGTLAHDAGLRVDAEVDIEQSPVEEESTPVNLGTYWIAGTPIWLTPQLSIPYGANVSAGAALHLGYQKSGTWIVEVGYQEGRFDGHFELEAGEGKPAAREVSVSCAVRVYAGPQLTLKVCSFAGPWLRAEMFGTLAARASEGEGLCGEAGIGLAVRAGMKFEFNIFGWSYKLAEWTSPDLAAVYWPMKLDWLPKCTSGSDSYKISFTDCGTPLPAGDLRFAWQVTDVSGNPSEIWSQYKLSGVDDFWSIPSSIRDVSYSQIPEGDHEFCVRVLANSREIRECCTLDGCSPDVRAPDTSITYEPPNAAGNVLFSWIAFDNCADSSELEYSYQLQPGSSSPSSWTRFTTASYSNLSPGEYTFCVDARDPSGNVSTQCIDIVIGQCPPEEGEAHFYGVIQQVSSSGGQPFAWIDDVVHIAGVDFARCYTHDPWVEVYCERSPCAGYVSPNLQSGEAVEVFGLFRDVGDGGYATISVDTPKYYVRREEPQIGETHFRGTAISEPGLIGEVNWTVSVDEVFDGADISLLDEVVVRLIINPTACFGNIYGDIQPGDTVWVFGYYNGEYVDLCPEETYYMTDTEPM